MKILYLAHRLPYPPNKGDKIRAFHEIEYFSRKHEVRLLAFCDQNADLLNAEKLMDYCSVVKAVPLKRWPQTIRAVRAICSGLPGTLGYFSSPAMYKAVSAELNRCSFDLVFAYSSSMAPYACSIPRIRRILDFVDSDAGKWQQYAKFKRFPMKYLYAHEAKTLAAFERNMIDDFDHSIFVSSRETEHLSDLADKRISFIQNGIDIEAHPASDKAANEPNIVFVGAMDYFPNIDAAIHFAHHVFPVIRSKCPEARFYIVGSRPPSSVLRLSGLPGVTVTGTVASVQPYLLKSRVAVIPIRISQGIQNKILEALAAGLPVVTTTACATGLRDISRLPVVIADDVIDMAEQVLNFLNRPLEEARVLACRQCLKEAYDWDTNLSAFDHLFAADSKKGSRSGGSMDAHSHLPS
jgi:sugar transferase (PEP-CTERM/EpsH1 system associated)